MIRKKTGMFFLLVGNPLRMILMIYLFFSIRSYAKLPGEYAVIEKDNLKGLINSKGKVLIPPEYEDVGWTTGTHLVVDGIIGYKSEDKWGLISIENDKITQAKYNSLEFLEEELIIASQTGLIGLTNYYGLINIRGKEIIPFKYISLKGVGSQMIAVTKNENDLIYGLIDKKDNNIIPFKYRKIEQIDPEIFSMEDDKGRIWLSNVEGNLLISESFSEIIQLRENLIVAKRDGKVGLLNKKGDLLLDPVYRKISIENGNKINVLPFTEWRVIDTINHVIQKLWFDEVEAVNHSIYKASINGGDAFIYKNAAKIGFSGDMNIVAYLDDLAIFKEKDKYGIMDYNGTILAEPDYEEFYVDKPFLFLKSNNYWTFLNTEKLSWYDGAYSSLSRLSQDFIGMKLNGFWGVLDQNGSILIETKYDSILEIRDNFLKVLFYGETGVVDISGEWKVLPRKAHIDLLSNNRILISSVLGSSINDSGGDTLYATDNSLKQLNNLFIEEDLDGLLGLVNSSYENILPVEKDLIIELIKNYIFLFHDKQGWGAVMVNGRILFEKDNRFQDIMAEGEGFIGVKIDGKYGFVDTRGRLRISNRYEEIGPFHNGLAPVKILDKWGYVDKYERIQVQPHYEQESFFRNGLAVVRKDKKFGLINTSGIQIIETEYDSIFRTSHETFILKYNDKYGLADDNGRVRLYPKFESLTDLGNGYIIARRKDKKGLISADGVTIIPQIYDEIIFDRFSENYICGKKSNWTTSDLHDLSTNK